MEKVNIEPLHSIHEGLLKQVALNYENLPLRHNTPHRDSHKQTCSGLMIEGLHEGLHEDLHEDLHEGLYEGLHEGLHANHEGPHELLAQEDYGQGGMGLVYVHYSMDAIHFLVDLCSGGCRGLDIETAVQDTVVAGGNQIGSGAEKVQVH